MRPNGNETALDSRVGSVVHAVYSTKAGVRFFHGYCASRAEAESLARAVTLPPYSHDLAVVRQSPASAAASGPERSDLRGRPFLATIDGRPAGGPGVASGNG